MELKIRWPKGKCIDGTVGFFLDGWMDEGWMDGWIQNSVRGLM